MKYNLTDILPFISGNYKITGQTEGKTFTGLRSILEATEDSLTFVDIKRSGKNELILGTQSELIICDLSIELAKNVLGSKCLIQVENPRLVFVRVGNALYKQNPSNGIHPTASIHPEAQIHENTCIGPFTYVGKCKIDEGTIIYGHVHLYDNVEIGKNVIIHAGCIIGADGFGFIRNEKEELENFPHLGGVVIEADVEIGANTCIDKGALGYTLVKRGAKIDNLVHIAHNVIVGKHAMVIANAMIGGSTVIEDYAWVSPSSSLRDQIRVGTRSLIGLGAVVTKNVPDGETWAGVPARPLQNFLALENMLRDLLDKNKSD